MKRIKIIYYFIKFLRKEKLFKKYIKYTFNKKYSYCYDYISFIKYIFSRAFITYPITILLCSFVFSITEEGLDYWIVIHNKWKKYYKLLNINKI